MKDVLPTLPVFPVRLDPYTWRARELEMSNGGAEVV